MRARRDSSFSLSIHERRTKKNWQNCMFWRRPKTALVGSVVRLPFRQFVDYRCSRRNDGEPVTSGVWMQWPGCFFLCSKKRFHYAYAAQSCIAMRGTRWCLLTGSICTLRVTPTARFEGRAISNVTMALLFFILGDINLISVT